jgi:hypothetical protein
MGGDGEIRGKADMFVVWPWMWRFSRGGVLSVEVMARSRGFGGVCFLGIHVVVKGGCGE